MIKTVDNGGSLVGVNCLFPLLIFTRDSTINLFANKLMVGKVLQRGKPPFFDYRSNKKALNSLIILSPQNLEAAARQNRRLFLLLIRQSSSVSPSKHPRSAVWQSSLILFAKRRLRRRRRFFCTLSLSSPTPHDSLERDWSLHNPHSNIFRRREEEGEEEEKSSTADSLAQWLLQSQSLNVCQIWLRTTTA